MSDEGRMKKHLITVGLLDVEDRGGVNCKRCVRFHTQGYGNDGAAWLDRPSVALLVKTLQEWLADTEKSDGHSISQETIDTLASKESKVVQKPLACGHGPDFRCALCSNAVSR